MSRAWRNFDWPLLAITLVMVTVGVIMVRSATINTPGLQDLSLIHISEPTRPY